MEALNTGALKPCRFCGAHGKEILMRVGPKDRGARVVCRNCAAETLSLPTMEDAARFWNQGYCTIPSHDERNILDACIHLMAGMIEDFKEYCDYMGWKPDPENEEEQYTVRIHYREIVSQLFLWNTHHSGGTSSEAKCRELGIEDGNELVAFKFEGLDEEPDEGAD